MTSWELAKGLILRDLVTAAGGVAVMMAIAAAYIAFDWYTKRRKSR